MNSDKPVWCEHCQKDPRFIEPGGDSVYQTMESQLIALTAKTNWQWSVAYIHNAKGRRWACEGRGPFDWPNPRKQFRTCADSPVEAVQLAFDALAGDA